MAALLKLTELIFPCGTLWSIDLYLQEVLQCILIRVEKTRAFNIVFFMQHHFYKESRIRSIRHEEHTDFDARSWALK